MSQEWIAIIDAIVQVAAAVAAALAPVLVGQLVRWLRHRTNMDVSHEFTMQLTQAVHEAINEAEQWARRRARLNTRPASDEKLERAVSHARRVGGPVIQRARISDDRLRELIEAELGRRNSLAPPPPSNGRGSWP